MDCIARLAIYTFASFPASFSVKLTGAKRKEKTIILSIMTLIHYLNYLEEIVIVVQYSGRTDQGSM